VLVRVRLVLSQVGFLDVPSAKLSPSASRSIGPEAWRGGRAYCVMVELQ